MINRFPEYRCNVCKGDDWWYRAGEWHCGVCHPIPDPAIKLRFRVIKGNYKLSKLLDKIREMKGEEREKSLEIFHEGHARLKALCEELKRAGATECLYIEDGKKVQRCLDDPVFTCIVCPNNYWWEKELLEIDRKRFPEAWKAD